MVLTMETRVRGGELGKVTVYPTGCKGFGV